MDIVHIGKAKTVYRTEDADEYIIEFRDDITAFNGKR
jgi:Phosphoribosylaminoimidazolesuccinocarboxamide (SAICAR) synthase